MTIKQGFPKKLYAYIFTYSMFWNYSPQERSYSSDVLRNIMTISSPTFYVCFKMNLPSGLGWEAKIFADPSDSCTPIVVL
jgi:hypothetical protein